jgi:ADP-ribose pyrophosphatase YjhB (NUDIX family)
MEISAGLLIIWKNKVLLAKPAKSLKKMWGLPKGKLEAGETYLDAAIRETEEEIGITVPKDMISKEYFTIKYKNSKTKKNYKTIIYYTVEIDHLSDLGLTSEVIPKRMLQLREIAKARFLSHEEAEEKIFWRQKEILNFIEKGHYMSPEKLSV